MLLDSKTAAVDNDFINHIVDSNIANDRLLVLLNSIFEDLGLSAVMHPLVYEKELLVNSPRIELLFQHKIIQKVEFSDIFLEDNDRKLYYFYLVEELFYALRNEHLPVNGEDILLYWERRKSLGEVHSVSMCLLSGCGVFLSDDADSKKLAQYLAQKTLGPLSVYNRKELIDKHMKADMTDIPRSERRSLTHSRS